MACGCGCNSRKCGIGQMFLPSLLAGNLFSLALSPRYGLSGLGNVPAGSVIRIGFRYGSAFNFEGNPEPAQVKATVEGCLYGTGAFNKVSVSVSQGTVYQDYATITATLSTEFSTPEDIRGIVEQRIRQCYPDIAGLLGAFDQVIVDAVPVGTPQQTISTIPTANLPGAAPQGEESLLQKLGLESKDKKSASSTTTLILLLVGAVVVSKVLNK